MNRLAIYITLLVILTNDVVAENYPSPLSPGEPSRKIVVGMGFGLGQNIKEGISSVNCVDCEFDGGVGFGYSVDFIIAMQLAANTDILRNFYMGLDISLANRDVSSAYNEISSVYLPNFNMTIPVKYKNTFSLGAGLFSFMPYLSYEPNDYLAVSLGLSAGQVFNDNLRHVLDIVDKRVTLPDGEIVDIYFPVDNKPNVKRYSKTEQDGPVSLLTDWHLYLVPSIAGNIYLNKSIVLSPAFYYYYPLNNFTENNDYKISAYRISVLLKYIFSL